MDAWFSELALCMVGISCGLACATGVTQHTGCVGLRENARTPATAFRAVFRLC